MSLELSTVGLAVKDMASSLEFYRRLGMDIPEGAEKESFVPKQAESGVGIFWNKVFDPDGETPAGGCWVMLEFFLEDERAVDAKYEEMVGHGYHGRSEPAQAIFGPYAAVVDDPDGNAVLLAAG